MAREFRSFRVEAVVLKHTDWGEADRIITMFSRQRGKLRAVAKGVRKIRSRRAGHLEPFTRVVMQLAKSKNLPIVTQAETLTSHMPLRDDLVLIGRASYAVELLDKFTYEEGENLSVYNLLADTLDRLEDPGQDGPLVLRYYEVRLLDYVGYRPELNRCLVCRDTIQPQAQYFSAELGGVVCPKCGRQAGHVRPLSLDALRYLRHFQRSSYQQAAGARPSAEIHGEMEEVMQYYLTYLLERGLNTPRFMRRVAEHKPPGA